MTITTSPREQALKAEIIRLMKQSVSADDRNARERIDDAKRAIGFAHDLLCSVTPERDLECLNSENLAGFLRLILAQFPQEE